MLVITDTTSQPSYQKQFSEIEKLMEIAKRVSGVIERKGTGNNAIGDEFAQVVIRRLFESIDTEAAETAAQEHENACQRMSDEYPDSLPGIANTQDYRNQVCSCYPFYPRLLQYKTAWVSWRISNKVVVYCGWLPVCCEICGMQKRTYH